MILFENNYPKRLQPRDL